MSTVPPISLRRSRKGVAADKPYLIDVNIAADLNPAGAGMWELPGLGQSKPSIGTRYVPA